MKKISQVQERIDFILPVIEKLKNLKIADLGCGTGLLSREIFLKTKIKVIGIDISKNNIEIAKRNCPQNKYLLADISQKNIPKMDIIVCSEVLEHLRQPEEIVKKVYKKLNKDGLFIVTIPNGYGPWELIENQPLEILRNFVYTYPSLKKKYFALRNRLDVSAEDSKSEEEGSRHIQRFTFNGFKKMIGMNGFKIVKTKNLFFISNILPFKIFKTKLFYRIDQAFCKFLPSWLASDWGFILKKIKN